MKDLRQFIKTTIREFLNENKIIYYDQPRGAILNHKEYDKLINFIKSKNNKKDIAKIIENWVIDNEDDLANSMGMERYVNCEHAAEMVSQILSDAKIHHTLQVGTINGQSHAWVKMHDIIIDPTKDQLPNIQKNDYNQDIYWEKNF